MKYDILVPYDEMENNGKFLATAKTNTNLVVCEVEHTDLMGGMDEINGKINLEALSVFLSELKVEIEEKGANHYGWVDMEVNGDIITFTDDTEPFAELQGKQAFVLDEQQMAIALVIIGMYFQE